MNRLALVLATWFGCGYFPWGPGTIGALVAVLIGYALHVYARFGKLTFLVLAIVGFVPAVWASARAARILGKNDPSIVVIDEVLGQWVTLLGATSFSRKNVLAAFLLFRVFDIWKPWPIRKIERLRGGYGIVCDDLAAGLYGALILYIGGVFTNR